MEENKDNVIVEENNLPQSENNLVDNINGQNNNVTTSEVVTDNIEQPVYQPPVPEINGLVSNNNGNLAPKKEKRIVVIISIIIIIIGSCVAVGLFVYNQLNKNNDSETKEDLKSENEENSKVENEDTALPNEEIMELIGRDAESYVLNTEDFTQEELLEYLNTLYNFECEIVEWHSDNEFNPVYFGNCSINGSEAIYTYGEQIEEDDEESYPVYEPNSIIYEPDVLIEESRNAEFGLFANEFVVELEAGIAYIKYNNKKTEIAGVNNVKQVIAGNKGYDCEFMEPVIYLLTADKKLYSLDFEASMTSTCSDEYKKTCNSTSTKVLACQKEYCESEDTDCLSECIDKCYNMCDEKDEKDALQIYDYNECEDEDCEYESESLYIYNINEYISFMANNVKLVDKEVKYDKIYIGTYVLTFGPGCAGPKTLLIGEKNGIKYDYFSGVEIDRMFLVYETYGYNLDVHHYVDLTGVYNIEDENGKVVKSNFIVKEIFTYIKDEKRYVYVLTTDNYLYKINAYKEKEGINKFNLVNKTKVKDVKLSENYNVKFTFENNETLNLKNVEHIKPKLKKQ